MTPTDLLTRRLELAYQWYWGMVNPRTRRLEYLYLPHSDRMVRENSPLRDIASAWDLEVLGEFLGRNEHPPLLETTLRHYTGCLLDREGFQILDPGRLLEPSSIAHSAFFILALLHAPPPLRRESILALAEGLLRQQRRDGSYQVYFQDLPDLGEELYAGEAMLALLETWRKLGDVRHLRSVERAYPFYSWKFQNVPEDLLVFCANWQSQAGRMLWESTGSAAIRRDAANHILGLHDRIIAGGFYREVERHPERQVSVEVACALEGLGEAYALSRATEVPARSERYRRCAGIALEYLRRLQSIEGGAAKERGGFGMSLHDRSQRIDVTGHAASALMKCVGIPVELREETSTQ